ncbi:hypothetical protein F1880_009409 [Penicillium rolfsii]|nr:hypothetical protein F1880_009409 [Penicillium rolfsii]
MNVLLHQTSLPDTLACISDPTESNGAVGGEYFGGTEPSAAGDLDGTSISQPRLSPFNFTTTLELFRPRKDRQNSPNSSVMAPLCQVFHAEELPHRVNTIQHNFKDKRRKGPAVNLKECQLLEMVQYSCNPPSEGIPQPGVVKCQPITRLFRR